MGNLPEYAPESRARTSILFLVLSLDHTSEFARNNLSMTPHRATGLARGLIPRLPLAIRLFRIWLPLAALEFPGFPAAMYRGRIHQ